MDFDRRLENKSYATVRCHTVTDREGYDVCLVIAKVAFRLSAQGVARIGFRPVRTHPVSEHGAIRFPHDLADEKIGTDIGLVGTAYPAPPREQKDARRAFAWLQVGSIRKVIQISGPSVYRAGVGGVTPADPGLLSPTPLRYDHAFGGCDVDGTRCQENPIGRGFGKDRTYLIGRAAPQLEPVYDPLRPEDKAHASHATFGPIWEDWAPRRGWVGTCDERWGQERCPIRPLDFDVRHHNWSSPGLTAKSPLMGDEPVEVGGVLPEGTWRFKLPLYPIGFESVLEDKTRSHPTHLDGFLIDADERVVELSYRASIRLPLKWAQLRRVRAFSKVGLPDEMISDEPWPKAI